MTCIVAGLMVLFLLIMVCRRKDPLKNLQKKNAELLKKRLSGVRINPKAKHIQDADDRTIHRSDGQEVENNQDNKSGHACANKAICDIVAEIGHLFHKDYPFLDACYSPGSYMPACDLTFYVVEMYSNGDYSSLRELWRFIGSRVEEVLFEKSLCASVPNWLEIDDEARAEIWAINALVSRSSSIHTHDESLLAGSLAASVLSTRRFSISSEFVETLEKNMRTNIKHNIKIGLIHDEPDALIQKNFAAIKQGTEGFEQFARMMSGLPPTARMAIELAAFNCDATDDYHRKIHYELGYGERAYGCAASINRAAVEALNILEIYDPTIYGVPSGVTKEIMCNGLASRGVAFKKSAKRSELYELVRQQPGLICELIECAAPEMKRIKSEYREMAQAWAKRMRDLQFVGMATIAYMQIEMTHVHIR